MQMTPRERVYKTLNHQEPDRIPICFGGTPNSGIEECPPDYCALSNLYQFLGLKDTSPVRLNPICNVAANIDEQCMERLHSDMRLVTDNPPGPIVIDDQHKVWPFFYGGRIVKCGLYEQIDFSDPPMINLKTEKDIEEYPYWPDPQEDNMRGVVERARKLHEETNYFVCGSPSSGHFPLNGYGLVSGMEKWLLDMKTEPAFYRHLCEKMMETSLVFTEKFYGETGQYLDAAVVFDDLGSQTGPLMSLADYRKFYKPYQSEIIKRIKTYLRPAAKIILKSSGSIYQFIPDLIEIGVDVLSPVQPLARNMEPWRLKKEFGKDLSFLGGFDLQRLLPSGSVDQIRKGVKILIDEFSKGGGYIFGASYILQCNLPPDKIAAMFDAAYEYGKYAFSEDFEAISFVDYIDGLDLSNPLPDSWQALTI